MNVFYSLLCSLTNFDNASSYTRSSLSRWPWTSYQIRKIAGAHAPGMPGTFSPPSGTSDPDMHHGTCVTHVPWCMPWSLTSVFLWSQWRGKTFPAFPAHAQPAISRIWQEAHWAASGRQTWHDDLFGIFGICLDLFGSALWVRWSIDPRIHTPSHGLKGPRTKFGIWFCAGAMLQKRRICMKWLSLQTNWKNDIVVPIDSFMEQSNDADHTMGQL